VASRTDPVDGFVDAVLAWDNMFSDTPETTFKVCGAITVLIGPEDLEGRKRFFAEVQKLYQTRSQILHGGNEPGIREAVRHRDRAAEIAVDCMRARHEQGDLLALPNSAQRGKHILLGSGAPRSSTMAASIAGG
jgi:hypothetical protein